MNLNRNKINCYGVEMNPDKSWIRGAMWAKHFKLRIRLEGSDFLGRITHFSSLEIVREKRKRRELPSASLFDPQSFARQNSSSQK